MKNRKPTWNYILNDLALSNLMTKCLYSNNFISQDKYDLEYQIHLIQQENKQLKQALLDIKEEITSTILMFGRLNGKTLYTKQLNKLLDIVNKALGGE